MLLVTNNVIVILMCAQFLVFKFRTGYDPILMV